MISLYCPLIRFHLLFLLRYFPNTFVIFTYQIQVLLKLLHHSFKVFNYSCVYQNVMIKSQIDFLSKEFLIYYSDDRSFNGLNKDHYLVRILLLINKSCKGPLRHLYFYHISFYTQTIRKMLSSLMDPSKLILKVVILCSSYLFQIVLSYLIMSFIFYSNTLSLIYFGLLQI